MRVEAPSDPRVVQESNLAPWLASLLPLLAFIGLRAGTPSSSALPRAPWARTAVLGGVAAALTAGLGVVLLEIGLRATGDHLPSWVTAQRRNLGEARTDSRWQDSARPPSRRPSFSGP